jgi:hypothetical protein
VAIQADSIPGVDRGLCPCYWGHIPERAVRRGPPTTLGSGGRCLPPVPMAMGPPRWLCQSAATDAPGHDRSMGGGWRRVFHLTNPKTSHYTRQSERGSRTY